MIRHRLRIVVAVAALAALTTLSGCSATAGGGESAAGSTSAADLAWAKELTDRHLAGTDRALPASGPKAVPGKNVWVVSCSSTGAGCNLPAQGVAEAGAKLGWRVTVVDGKINPAVYNSGIRNAIAAKADAVVLTGVDCASTQAAIKDAKAAGIKVFGVNALDCDDKYAGGGTKLFSGAMPWGPENQAYGEFLDTHVGPAIAAWVITKTNGTGNILLMTEADNAATRHVGDAEAATLAQRCRGCTVNTVAFTGADLLAGLQAKVSAALGKYPKADVVMVPIDAAVSLGTSAAVQQARASGRRILLVGQEGVPASVGLVKQGIQDYAAGRPMTWAGWAAADELNRLFAGQPLVDEGIGFGAMDQDHRPAGDSYDGNPKSSGYRANLQRIWGVS
ncbi:sugar ABC transporter substrate-binding protein [Amycolatopsis jejuensis]|uniref:sugar ABC transporter substrate-binding protein n=1 Tax=Amycolatopsis jejuensis TaxID=330084 RepID=UPI000526861C|nr:substrate-binding domain-containing protein [Amycolatopsis jejuensis]